MPSGWSLDLAEHVYNESKGFVRAVQGVATAVHSHDRGLTTLLGNVEYSRFNTFHLSTVPLPFEDSMFSIKFADADFLEIRYSLPSSKIDGSTLQKAYQAASHLDHQITLARAYGPPWYFDKLDVLVWPKEDLRALFSAEPERRVRSGDRTEAILMHSVLLRQLDWLSGTCEILSEFIKNNFQIEDLLFRSDRVMKR